LNVLPHSVILGWQLSDADSAIVVTTQPSDLWCIFSS
jgi:hypothetical protein